MSLVAPRHVGSSWTRARIHVPCIGGWILNHCVTREVPEGEVLTTGLPGKSYDTVFNLMVATWLLLLWAPNPHSRQEEEGFVLAETIPFGRKVRQQTSSYITWPLLTARGPDNIHF